MSKGQRKKDRMERRKKKGLPPDGTHRNKYASSSPGEREKMRSSRKIEEPSEESSGFIGHTWLDTGRSSSYGSSSSYYGSENGSACKVLLLYDPEAQIGLIIGERLPESQLGSGEIFGLSGSCFMAMVVRDVANPQDLRKSGSYQIKYTQVVGREGFIPENGTSEYYRKAGSKTHPFDLIRQGGSEAALPILREILEKISNKVPESPKKRTGRENSDYGFF